MSTNEAFIQSITARIEEAKQRPAQTLEHWYVIVLLGDIRYALPMTRVREIVRTPALTPIPNAETYIQGIFLHRGAVVPVIDITKRFQSKGIASRVPTHVVIVEERGALYGFLVDHVIDAMEFPPQGLRVVENDTHGLLPSPYLVGAWDHDTTPTRARFRYDFLIASPTLQERFKDGIEEERVVVTTFLLSVERMVESLENDVFRAVV